MKEKKQMYDKKQNSYTAPDMSKMKPVVIDQKTRIYIPKNADPEEARARYWSNREAK